MKIKSIIELIERITANERHLVDVKDLLIREGLPTHGKMKFPYNVALY